MELMTAIIAAIIGVLLGGVINALADDLPHRRRPGLPHDAEGRPRPPSAWLGLTAFLTGQRKGVRWRHPVVESGMGLAFAGMALAFHDEPHLPVWMVYVAVLVLITVIDIEHRLVLFAVILPACLFALGVAAVAPEDGKTFTDYLIGGAAGFILFFLMFLGGVGFSSAAKTGEIAFGFGDVMLATLSGLMIGWRAFIFASLITVFAGALGALIYLTTRSLMRRRYRWFTPLPYGPYIVIGTLIMLLFREDVARLLGANY